MSKGRQLDRTETPVARMRHGCEICLRWIAPGERYVRWTGIDRDTGDLGSSAYCQGCDLAWQYCCRFLDCDDCWIIDCLAEEPDRIMAAVLHEAISDRWWTRPLVGMQ